MLKRNFLNVVITIVLIISLFVLFSQSDNYINCRNYQYFHEISFEGVIEKKYLDRSHHSVPVIEVVKNSKVSKISFSGEFSGIYDKKLNVGDLVKKSSNDLKIFVLRQDKLELLGLVNFNCDSVAFKEEDQKFGFIYRIFK